MKSRILALLLGYPFCFYISMVLYEQKRPAPGSSLFRAQAMISRSELLLQEGDLIFRLNRDPASRFIRYFNRTDKSFSHSGIVLCDNGHPYVYHILAGEENPDGKLRRDFFRVFCDPSHNMAFGIYRPALQPGEIARLKKIILTWYQQGIRFDTAFNLQSDDRMYCSEMVSKAIGLATGHRISFSTTRLTTAEALMLAVHEQLPFTYTQNLSVVPIDALYANPSCRPISKCRYVTQ